MSFSFQAVKQNWNSERTRREVTELRLFDASIVTYPANPATTASLRAQLTAALGAEGRARLYAVEGVLAECRQGKAISAANAELLQTALGALHQADDKLSQLEPILTEVNSALDEGQKTISATIGATDPDGDPSDTGIEGKSDNDAKGTDKDGATSGGAGSGGGNPLNPNDGAGVRKIVLITVLETRPLLAELNRVA
jgi:hypothetical protein